MTAKPALGNEAFVIAWQEAQTLGEAAQSLGIAPHEASSRASRLRRRGVALKTFGASTARIDVEALSKLARKVGKGK